ncbi:MAG: DUF928 domain-containing protein [Merismopedia sp. SIO2A8]|nr:DUF928 domain-containing protein [Merismopedia sp. SIO2A8]
MLLSSIEEGVTQPLPTQSLSHSATQSLGHSAHSNNAFHPPATSRSRWGRPGGSRGSRLMWADGHEPVALVTDSPTLVAHPTLFIYLPELTAHGVGEEDLTLFFAVMNEEGDLIYELEGPLPTTGGIFGIQLDGMEDASPLESNTQYRWLIFAERQYQVIDNFFMEGWIERVGTNASALPLSNIPLSEQPYVYRDAGLWYEAVESLFALKVADPDHATVNTDIQELLTWIGLEGVTSDDFVGYWPNHLNLPADASSPTNSEETIPSAI